MMKRNALYGCIMSLLRGIIYGLHLAQVPKTGMVRAQHRESLPSERSYVGDRETLLPRHVCVKRIGRPLKNGWIAPCKCPVMSLEVVHKRTPLMGNTSLVIEERDGAI